MFKKSNKKSTLEKRIEMNCQAFSMRPTSEQQFSIYRVPAHIRGNNRSYYEPRMVSIGPYHHGIERLRAMEEHKWRYLGEFIKRGRGTNEDYIQAIRAMESSIRACYFESFNMREDQFVQTMLLDSCFIIQLFIKWRFREPDPVRDVGWTLPLVMADLIMIENQIPLFVLTKMYNIHMYGNTVPPDNHDPRRPCLIKLMSESLQKMHVRISGQDHSLPEACMGIMHLLHLYYFLFVPAPAITRAGSSSLRVQRNNQEDGNCRTHVGVLLPVCNPRGICGTKEVGVKERRSPRMIPSATELTEFGVTFKKKKKSDSILDISFKNKWYCFKNGVLEIPFIMVEESTRSRYLNLIAFEQCTTKQEKHLTSFAVLMDCLINTSEDVITLQRCGIIENKLANTHEVAKFFHQLRDCAYIDFEDHYLKNVFVDVTNHCEAYWPKHRAKLCHDYFSSPWAIFSLCAALLVLGITIVRFIFMFIYH